MEQADFLCYRLLEGCSGWLEQQAGVSGPAGPGWVGAEIGTAMKGKEQAGTGLFLIEPGGPWASRQSQSPCQ